MLDFVLFVVGVLVVGTVLFLLSALLLGRGESQQPADPGQSPVELPADRPVLGDDVRGLQLSVAARGYRMTEVDWLLDQLAVVLDERDAELAALRAELHPGPDGGSKDSADTPDPGGRLDEGEARA